MQRRSPRAAIRFKERNDPVDLTSTEFYHLYRIKNGWPSTATIRQRLTSRGLVTSTVASKCTVTRKALASMKRYAELVSAGYKKPRLECVDQRREAWLSKHAPVFSRASA